MSIQLAELLQAFGSCGPAGEEVFDVGGESTRTVDPGVYTITLDAACAATECCVMVTPRSATFGAATVEHTSATVKTVRMWNAAGAALNCGFDYEVRRRSPNLNG